MTERKTELLAPAGSYEAFEAALGAGADAVYVGGPAFGARAYAPNFTEEELLQAIRTAHIHGKKLYLTVNTLLKNKELREQLYDVLLPCYEEGLDAVIIQDMGVFQFIRNSFPGMHLHASTQMTVTGPLGMKFLEEQGADRVVAARELSLEELAAMHQASPIEIEAFIHGALCYSFSGQCLMSSMLGGRSGNRGRCAQPCRLPYQTGEKRGSYKGGKNLCPLSLKDICTLDILPEIIRAGVTSLKIEGRMKQPEYTAGVTKIYRKYLDRFLQYGEKYQVEEADRQYLLDLFNRGGSCSGYYQQHNGPSMMAFSNEKKTAGISEGFSKAKEPLKGVLVLRPGNAAVLELSCREAKVTVSAGEIQEAKEHPMTEERIRKQLEKLGNTEFFWESLEIRAEGSVFVPVSLLNEIRRSGIARMEDELCAPGRRTGISEKPVFAGNTGHTENSSRISGAQRAACRGAEGGMNAEITQKQLPLYVSCETREQALAVFGHKDVQGIYLNYDILSSIDFDAAVQKQELYLALPHVTRGAVPPEYEKKCLEWLERGLTGFLVRNLESFAWLKGLGLSEKAVLDASMYTWNDEAKYFWQEQEILRDTVPLELNAKEILHRDNRFSEMIIYGYAPLMLSAQCVRKNLLRCDKKEGRMYLRDRYNAEFTSVCVCSPWKMRNTGKQNYCYNILYNSIPTGLLKEAGRICELGITGVRMAFTLESGREAAALLEEFCGVYYHRKTPSEHHFTGGHFKRGAE